MQTSLECSRKWSKIAEVMVSLLNIIRVLLVWTVHWPVRGNGQGIDLIDLPESTHNISSFLCIVQFCLKYFHSEKAVIGSLVIVNLQNGTEFHSELIIALNERTNYEMSLMTKDGTKKHGSPVHVVDKAKNYFVMLNKTSEIYDAIRQWHKLPTWNPLAQVVVLFINTYDKDQMDIEIFEVLRAFMDVNMLNVNVISYQIGTNLVLASTFYPYQEADCANVVTKLVTFDACEYNDNYDAPLAQIKPLKRRLPKIPGKLHDCPLNISTAISEPYVFYDKEKGMFSRGTEVLMVRTIAEALQMTPVFTLIAETRETRVISNETGVYSTLFQKKADILIGGMENDPKIQKILWNSIPYRQDDETWCVAIARPRDLWRNIFGLYKTSTWSALMGAIVLIATIIYLLIHIEYKAENYMWSLMMGIGSSLGLTVQYEPTRTSLRVMMLFFFLYGLITSSTFNSFLISILTRPRYNPQVNSLRMAIEQGFDLAGGDVTLSHYMDDTEVSRYVRNHYTLCNNNIDKCLQLLLNNEKLAVAVSRLHAENSPVVNKDDIFCFLRENNIYSFSVAMPMRLDFQLMPSINRIIRQLFEFGLVERWDKLSQAIATSAIAIRLALSGGGDESTLVVLTVGHIMGSLLILMVGHVFATCAFCLEIIVDYMARRPNAGAIWIRLNDLLVPKPARTRSATLFN